MPADVSLLVVGGVALLTAAVGALGGIGGAILLVPVLVVLGVDPFSAAPLGLVSVAAGSLAAGPAQLRAGVVHHRLAVVTETAATGGVIVGALAAALVPGAVLARVLGVCALAAAAAGLWGRGADERPEPSMVAEEPGEWPGTLSGTYRAYGRMVPYEARNLGAGLGATAVAGVAAGLVGVGGGFIKTPAMALIMRVPVKVAAATTTFTVGITSAAGLLVFAAQGRVDVHAGAAVVLGALAGGALGAIVQERFEPKPLRVIVSLLIAGVGALLIVTG